MLAAKNRFKTLNFQSHPTHNLFSLIMALILFAMLLFVLATPAR